MLAETFLRSRIERIIAGARLAIALFALVAVWSVPSQPATAAPLAYTVLLAYLAVALALVLLGSRRLVSNRLALIGHATDLCVFTVLMVLTDGPGSPFFLLFTFSVVSATFRWQWRGALATSAAVLLLFAAVWIGHANLPGPVSEPDRLLLRAGHVLVLGAMLGLFGYLNERVAAELQRASTWRADPLDRDADSLLGRWMSHVADTFLTDRAALVIDDSEEPWLTVARLTPAGLARERLTGPAFDALVAPSLAEAIFLREEAGGETVTLDPAGRSGRWTRGGVVLDPALEQSLGYGALISAPIAAEAVRGRLFVASGGHASVEDLTIAGLVAGQLAAALDRIAAVDALRRAAAADERLRLARDLHDGVLQTLAGTALQLENVAKGGADAPVRDRIQAIQNWLIGEQREMRAFIRNLRPDAPSAAAGTRLDTSLARLCQTLEQQWGLECRLAVEPQQIEASALISFQLHQILREAAANAARHGGATVLDVTLRARNGAFGLAVADNGTGLGVRGRLDERECRAARIGPRSLRERVCGLGGRFQLVSSDAGLTVEIELPAGPVEQAA